MSPTDLMKTLTRVREERDVILLAVREYFRCEARIGLARTAGHREMMLAMDAREAAVEGMRAAVVRCDHFSQP